MPPFPDFSNVTSTDGLVMTDGGGRFQLQKVRSATTGPPGSSNSSTGNNVGFVSQWTNHPTTLTVPLSASAGDVVWLLVSGSTNNMQTRLANAVLRFNYSGTDADGDSGGRTEELELVPPLNYWSLTKIAGIDYDYARDGFCLPAEPPPQMQLGKDNDNIYSRFGFFGEKGKRACFAKMEPGPTARNGIERETFRFRGRRTQPCHGLYVACDTGRAA